MTNWPIAIIFSAMCVWIGWVLFRALSSGTLQVLRGSKTPKATRADTPIIFWGFVGLNVLILTRVAATALRAWGLAIPISL